MYILHWESCFVIFLPLWLWHTSCCTTMTECCGILVAVPVWRNLFFDLYATLIRNLILTQFYVYFVSWPCIHTHDNTATTSMRDVLCESCFVIFWTLWLWHTCYCTTLNVYINIWWHHWQLLQLSDTLFTLAQWLWLNNYIIIKCTASYFTFST